MAAAKKTTPKVRTDADADAGQSVAASPDGGTRAEASLNAFRDAIDKSVTVSRERIQAVADDAVKRGRMTRDDAEQLVGKLVARGRQQAEELVGEIEQTLTQIGTQADAVVRDPVGRAEVARRRARRQVAGARRDVEVQAERARREVGKQAKRAQRRTMKAVDEPLAKADRSRRRAGLPGFPISAYDQLSVPQVAGRLTELTRAELRKVRAYESRTRSRKGVMRALDRELDSER